MFGSVFWLVKQVVEGIKGVVDVFKVVIFMLQIEEDFWNVDQVCEVLLKFMVQVVLVMMLGVLKGMGGVFVVFLVVFVVCEVVLNLLVMIVLFMVWLIIFVQESGVVLSVVVV